MTLGNLKQRILSLLEAGSLDLGKGSFYEMAAPLLVASINAVSDKVALALKCFYREKELSFSESAFGAKASLPMDFAMMHSISVGGKRYAGEAVSVIGDTLYFFGGRAGVYTLGYYAFAEAFDEHTDEDTMLLFDDYAADTIAYGVAAELCLSLYPSDMVRYARLATEFDERMTAHISRAGEKQVADTLFGKKRGDFL